MHRIIASERVVLDSNVYTGGGTDLTAELQAILDLALDGGVYLIMDGAALIHGLKVHSNTVIECANSSCGFFMADHSDKPMFVNSAWSLNPDVKNRDISFIGGTYNHNCTKQAHEVKNSFHPWPDGNLCEEYDEEHFVYMMEFYGVENFRISGVSFRNQRTFTLTVANFKNVIVEDSNIAMAEHVHPSNQDGFHFFGPGQFLTLRNVRGCTGDDFINIGPDELDGVSSITDILLDGIYFDSTCQGIRMLSRGSGMLDRLTVRNVTGTFRTFGFSINPFFHGETFGKYGDLYFENIDLRQIEATYNYTPLTFFQVGGDFHCITMKNVRFHNPVRNSLMFDIGCPFFYRPSRDTGGEIDHGDDYFDREWMPEIARPRIETFIIDGLTVTSDEKFDGAHIFELRYNVDNFVAKNVQLFRSDSSSASVELVNMQKEAAVKNMIIEDIFAEKLSCVLKGGAEHKIDLLKLDNVVAKDCGKILDADDTYIGVKLESGVVQV